MPEQAREAKVAEAGRRFRRNLTSLLCKYNFDQLLLSIASESGINAGIEMMPDMPIERRRRIGAARISSSKCLLILFAEIFIICSVDILLRQSRTLHSVIESASQTRTTSKRAGEASSTAVMSFLPSAPIVALFLYALT